MTTNLNEIEWTIKAYCENFVQLSLTTVRAEIAWQQIQICTLLLTRRSDMNL